MEPPYTRTRSRSRSPDSQTEVKLHVSGLSVFTQQTDLEAAFSEFGEVTSVRIIRKSSTGIPLRDSVYGFVGMKSHAAGVKAMEVLRSRGWAINFSKKSNEQRAEPKRFPSYGSLLANCQTTMMMMMVNNPSLPAGMPVDTGIMQKLINDNHPSAQNMPLFHPSLAGSYMVREVWIGNISSITDNKSLYRSFLQFGPIEGIEMFNSKGFAFVKFRRIADATLAYERGQGMPVDKRPVKVAFADPTRRIDIIGDSITPENPEFNPVDDDFFKTLYVGYSTNVRIPSDAILMPIFSRYGTVTGIHIRQGTQNSKPYAFVDYEKGEQAAVARRALYIDDEDGARRAALGDPALEISFKNTNKSVNKNGVKNGVRFQDQLMMNRDVKGMTERLLHNASSVLPTLQQISVTIPKSYAVTNSAPTEPEKADEEPHVIWSGFMTRNKKHRVGIDMSIVKGNENCISEKIYHLNITHRVSLSEVNKYAALAVVSIEASNDTQMEEFNNYIRYFSAKQRAGYILLKDLVIYILPPVQQATELYSKLASSQLLGVLVDPVKKLSN